MELANYTRRGGYQALRTALTMAPADVVKLVKDSGLRGRGGRRLPDRDEVVASFRRTTRSRSTSW